MARIARGGLEAGIRLLQRLFGWRQVDAEVGSTDLYQLFSAGDETIGGMFTKHPQEPVPFWLYYFDVDDLDAAAARVTAGGGQIFQGPFELPDGSWTARCRDPQGTAFALQGNRSQDAIDRTPASELGWSSAWGGISSRGRLVLNKTSGKGKKKGIKKNSNQPASVKLPLSDRPSISLERRRGGSFESRANKKVCRLPDTPDLCFPIPRT
jgi:Predicted enzyme related to lactoylglutathione lyase